MKTNQQLKDEAVLERDRVCKKALDECVRACEPAYAVYERACSPKKEEYRCVYDAALAEYDMKNNQQLNYKAELELDRVRNAAWAKCVGACTPAFEVYELACAPEMEKYKRVCADASSECERICAAIDAGDFASEVSDGR